MCLHSMLAEAGDSCEQSALPFHSGEAGSLFFLLSVLGLSDHGASGQFSRLRFPSCSPSAELQMHAATSSISISVPGIELRPSG